MEWLMDNNGNLSVIDGDGVVVAENLEYVAAHRHETDSPSSPSKEVGIVLYDENDSDSLRAKFYTAAAYDWAKKNLVVEGEVHDEVAMAFHQGYTGRQWNGTYAPFKRDGFHYRAYLPIKFGRW